MTFPKHVSMSLEHNNYKGVYDSIETAVAEEDENEAWVNAEERQKVLDTGELWTLHWYPDTPVGFCRRSAASLEKVLEA